jgi:thiamine biosynthesis lipoprotein
MPAAYYMSVTIIAKDSGIADALSTAVYNMPLEVGMDLINSTDNAEAMWVQKDGSVVYSDGFEKYLAE